MTHPLQTAMAHLQAGRVAEAEAACSRLLAAQPGDAHATHLLGLVYRQQGRLDEAETLMLRSVGLQPGNPEFRTNLAQLLGARERIGVSIEEFQRALSLAPDFRPALLGLARLAARTGRFALAETQARRLVALNAQDPQGWSALGAALHGLGRHSDARAAFERSVAIAPNNGATRYALASTLCEEDLAEQALAQADAAASLGVAHRALAITRARALMQLDRYGEAESLLTQLVAAAPDDLQSHFLLAQLRHTRGDADFAKALEQAASSASATPAIRSAYADLLRLAGQHGPAEAVLRKLIADQGQVPQLLTALGTLLHETGRYPEAVECTRAGYSRQQDDVTAAENHVAALLSAGAGKEARSIIEAFGRRNPLDQRWITYRADAARQCGETLYQDWCDPQAMVQVYDLEPPAGYASMAEFHAALAAQLQARHRQRSHPLDQSLRHGTQTSRGLLADSDPVIRQLLAAMAAPIAQYQATMRRDPSHPLFSRNTAPAKMVGCWSIRLQRGGYHVNHIHPQGWISSAYYVSVPAEVQDESLRSGWIKFGEPRFPMPGAAADRFVQPRPGRLVLFPSYLWHGTTPIQGDEPRLTAAFDAVP